MKKINLDLLLMAITILLLPSCSYNSLVSYDGKLQNAWADVEAVSNEEVT